MDAVYHQVLLALPTPQLDQKGPLETIARAVGAVESVLLHRAPGALLVTYVYRTRDEALGLAARAEAELGLESSLATIPVADLPKVEAVMKRRYGLDVMDLLPPK